MRKLATIETISEIKTHTNADALELAMIRGWQVVVRKGEFQPGDKVIYLEIDSWVPTEIAPFLSKGNAPREFEGVKGERLRTIKLRNALSQGLILPLSVLENFGKLVLGDDNRYSLIINRLLNCEDNSNANLSDFQ